MTNNVILISGCAPIPLAHYLKALGILRLVTEQANTGVKASWQHEQFVLNTALDAEALTNFFCRDYRPSPVLAPWNGGSGFFAKDNADALTAIEKSPNPRLALYRQSITAARRELKSLGLKVKPEGDAKSSLLQSCRNSFPEDALGWLDAVFVLSQDGAKFPPLLGTGGNDGRLEFTNNFMQRLTEVMDVATGQPTPESELWLRAALFAEAAPGLAMKAPIGQFFPGAAGGANATSGFDGPSAVNPWDFILMIEGALLFAAASVKRLESDDEGALVYPFCVRQAGVGYASAAGADEAEARCEMWMPLWNEPATLAELRAIFSEGRAQVSGRAARTGVDFAQAAVTLGVDRGIAAFQRYGFQVRNGLAYFATPLDRIVVRRNARADLLADIEQWHDRLRQKAGPRANPGPPASVARALNQLERRIFDLCRDDSSASLQSLLAALGATERALARSFRWTTENYLRPLAGLRREWLERADDGLPEFRLAQSVAAMRAWFGSEAIWFREQLEPLEMGSTKERSWVKWADQPSNDVAWHDGELTNAFNAILARRLVRVEKSGRQGWPDWSPRTASLADITEFIEGRTNDALLADLIWGLSLVDWARIPEELNAGAKDEAIPSSFYALLRLCFRRANKGEEQDAIPLVPSILHRAINGQGKEASILAARRLRASGHAPLVDELPVAGDAARRTAAAMVFPIAPRDFRLLEQMTLKQLNTQTT
ncbi:MAG TPA: type I-U CRISPR-associated protein Csx17 [Verrucomicrobiae bacterium]|nr:type I-U CRISPR-associated protein Csx17 [Verrucomicrobiae bacterium]